MQALEPWGTLSPLHSLGTGAGCDGEGHKVICSYLGHSWNFTSRQHPSAHFTNGETEAAAPKLPFQGFFQLPEQNK